MRGAPIEAAVGNFLLVAGLAYALAGVHLERPMLWSGLIMLAAYVMLNMFALPYTWTITGLVIGALFCIYIGPIQQAVEFVTGANLFSADVYFLSHIPAKIDWGEVALVTGWGLLMSFLATLPPAWRASHIDPVEALRSE